MAWNGSTRQQPKPTSRCCAYWLTSSATAYRKLQPGLSPILLEQLAHPTFQAEFPKYLTRKIVASREDEAFFIQAGEVI